MAPPSDPNLLYDTRHALDEFGVLDEAEAATFARLLLAERMDHGRLHAALGQAIQRFGALAEDEQDHFRDGLSRFVRTYSFLSQLVSFTDPALEPSSFPVDATVVVDKGGQLSKRTAFYVRIGNGTREISDFAERGRYLASRFSSGRAA